MRNFVTVMIFSLLIAFLQGCASFGGGRYNQESSPPSVHEVKPIYKTTIRKSSYRKSVSGSLRSSATSQADDQQILNQRSGSGGGGSGGGSGGGGW